MKSQKGASSVLVLLVMLLLVFLGVLAIVTSGSNLRLAKKNAESVKAWYRMDTIAERQLSDVVRNVRSSYADAVSYMEGRRFLDDRQDVVPMAAMPAIRFSWSGLSTDSARNAFLAELFPKVYAILSERALQALTVSGVEVRTLSALTDGTKFLDQKPDTVQGPLVLMRISDPDKVSSGTLEISVQVVPETMAEQGGHVRILQWKQDQAPFEYKNEIKLWEGIIK